jgi:UDP:flavonoid glycosyltransferase YjiC (YdhE family)
MRVLFTAQPGAGHWHPLVPLAQALAAAGHEVAFAIAPGFCPRVEATGFRCFPVGVDETEQEVRERGDLLSGLPGKEQAAYFWSHVFGGTRAERTLPDVLALARSWRPDLVVRENMEFTGCMVAERLGIPHAAVQVTAWRPHMHPLVVAPLNAFRGNIGLPPDPDLAMLHRFLLLDPAPPGYRNPAAPLPPTTHALRPIAFDRAEDEEAPDWLRQLPSGRPVVYATLGTVYNRTPGVMEAIVAGVREEPVTLIVTVGRNRDPSEFGEQPEHVRIERYVPQSLLFPHCDLVITHGGSGTVLSALEQGLPMVMIPIAADQPDNAERCAELGVARVIAPDTRTADAIRDAVREVLTRPSYRECAEQIRAETASLPGPEEVVGLLETLAREKTPVVAAG